MKTLIKLIILLIACCGIISAQSITLSASGVSSGGGFSSGETIGMYSSAGVPAADTTSGDTSGYFSIHDGIIPTQNVFTGTTFSLASAINGSWNMVSVPSVLADNRKSSLFPSALSKAFAYEGSYKTIDTLKRGLGYWVKYGADTTLQFLGTSFVRETIDVANNWNMIGGISYPIASIHITPVAPVTITSPYFGYSSGSGYGVADTLMPGRAYWIKIHNAGKLIVDANSSFAEAAMPSHTSLQSNESVRSEKPFSTLQVTDAKGRSRTLYFSSILSKIDLDLFELPPAGPTEVMDVRYGTNRMLAIADKKPSETRVTVSSAEYPLKIQWKNSDTDGNATLLVNEKEIRMTGTGTILVENPESRIRLQLSPSSSKELPKEFALLQNYPNPFNPSTVIRYQLPATSRVTLKVYNILGQEVVTLVDELEEAGYKSMTWNASGVASGVYYYRLAAGTFTEVKKMMVIK